MTYYLNDVSHKNIHAIEKKIDSVDSLEGSGSTEVQSTEIGLDQDPLEYNENQRKRLGSPVHESFLHPKMIKTDRIYFQKPPQKKEQMKESKSLLKKNDEVHPSKTIKHKFQFI